MKKRIFAVLTACAVAASLSVSAFAVNPGSTNGASASEKEVKANEDATLTTDTGVSVDLPAGTLAADTQVKIETNTTTAADVAEAVVTAVQDAVKEAVEKVLAAVAPDSGVTTSSVTLNTKVSIDLKDTSGNKVEFVSGKKAKVTIAWDGVSNCIAYVGNNTVEFFKLTVADGLASFETPHFSDYYLVSVDNEVLDKIEGQTAEVSTAAIEAAEGGSGSGNTDGGSAADDKNNPTTGVAIAVVPALAAAAAVVVSKKRK